VISGGNECLDGFATGFGITGDISRRIVLNDPDPIATWNFISAMEFVKQKIT
jgi:hypothetical protein